MAGKTAGLGLIGAGGTFGTFTQSALRDVEGGELRAIADVNERALAEAKQHLGIDRGYTDWRRLLDDDQVDVVMVATPPFTQFEIAHAVLERGKPLFLEKPGSVRLADMRKLVDVQRSKDVPATVDYVMRWNKLLDIVRDVRRRNWLGELRSVQFVNYAQDEVLPPKHWFWDREKSGGIFVEHSVHFFDLYGELVGAAPKEIVSTRSVRDQQAPGGREDQVDGVVRYDNEILCAYFHAFNRPKALERQQAILAFDHGYLTVHGWIADKVELDGWVDRAAADALAALPHIMEKQIEAIDLDLHGRDADWHADRKVALTFGLPWDRQESYRREVAAGISDLLERVRDRQHRQRVTLTDALRSLAIGCVAAGTASMAEARDIYARYRPDGR